MIPRTATPGAKDAGVAQSLDVLMRNWASSERRAQFRTLVNEIAQAGFVKASPGGRLQIARKFDRERLSSREPTYTKFKELILITYYLSEAGATKELRYEPIRGKFEGSTELAPDAPAWAV